MVPLLLSDTGVRKTVRRMSLLLAGGLGLALLPLAGQAQIGRSSSSSQPMYRTQTIAPMQGYSSAPRMNQNGLAGPRMLPGNPNLQGGMFPHYGLGYHYVNPGIIYRPGPSPEQNPGLFGGPPVAQNFGLFGPNRPLIQEPPRPLHNPNGYGTPMQQTNRPGTSFYGSAPPGGSIRHVAPYTPNWIINPRPYERIHFASEYIRFENGIYGRAHCHHYHGWYTFIFPDGMAYFPSYSLDYLPGVTCPSPYAYYLGAFPPYISAGDVNYAPPQDVYVPTPLYSPEGAYQGYPPEGGDSSNLNQAPKGSYRIGEESQPISEKPDDVLKAAVDDIQKAWQDRDIQFLVKHIRNDSQIAVYLRGKYQYSLDSGDYVDMTRDAFRATKTVKFVLDGVQGKADGVYVVTGHHVYQDKDGAEHTVHISYVLERADDSYYITQVGTDPDKATSLKGDEDKAPRPSAGHGDVSPPATGQPGEGQPAGSGQTDDEQSDDGASGQ